MGASEDNKLVARHAFKAFDGSPQVQKYHHDTEPMSLDILKCADRPCRGVTSYSTIGLSDHPMFQDGEEFPTRLEIAGACATSDDQFPNILASAAFSIMRSRQLYAPGSVIAGYVREYYKTTTVPHLFLTTPFVWKVGPQTLDCNTKWVSWLLAVPISDAEQDYLKSNGDDALENLFEKHQIDIFNLRRQSVVQ